MPRDSTMVFRIQLQNTELLLHKRSLILQYGRGS